MAELEKGLTLDEIMAANDRPIKRVAAWGGVIYVRLWSGTERDAFEQWADERPKRNGQEDGRGLRAMALALSLCDSAGKPLVAEGEWQATAERLARKSGNELGHVFTVIGEMNGLLKSDIENLGKNLDGAPSADSGSCSPAP